MRALTTISLLIAVFATSFAIADGKDTRRHAPNPPAPSQTLRQGQTRHHRPPQHHEQPRHNDHHRPITIGSVLRDIFLSPPVVFAPPYQPYYQPCPQTYGYGQYRTPCVLETPNGKVIVSQPYDPGTQLTVLGGWVTDPSTSTKRPMYRQTQAILVVEQSNGVTSLCSVVCGYASRGNDVARTDIAPTAGY